VLKFRINKKVLIPIFAFIISIFLCTFIWDFIKLPYNLSKGIYGHSYFVNSHNSLNDTLRFLIFIFFPIVIYILSKSLMEKNVFEKFFSFLNFNYSKKNLISNNSINIFFYFLVILVFFEFFLIDFSKLNYQLDVFHEGLWLTASSNLNIKNEFFLSSYVGRGFYGNFHPYFLWKMIGFESIGITRFFSLFINLIIKLFCLLIAKKISLATNFKKNELTIFFILLSLIFLSLTSYNSPIFFDRTLVALIFIFLLLNYFFNKPNPFSLILIGFFSSLSMFWYIDIGIYINFFLLVLLVFFLVKRDFRNSSLVILGIFISWVACLLIFSSNELDAFVKNTVMIFSTIDQIQGIVYPTPFFSGDSRATKSLLLFLISGFLIVNLILKDKQNHFFLISLIILFIFSGLFFKYGLSRSDAGHIRVASGFITMTFFTIIVFHLVSLAGKFFKTTRDRDKKFKFTISILILVVVFSLFFEKKYETKNIKNISTFMSSVIKLIKSKDEVYLSPEYIAFVDYYKSLAKEDNCVFIFTGEVALPYLLKKETCSKHFINYISSPKDIQMEIIKDLGATKPKYILYKSDIDLYYGSQQKLKYVNNFLKKRYTKYTKFKKWEIHKINDF
jgi:hypothetical protein